jgi:hypothetical protein
LIGGWIARHELAARRRGQYDIAEVPLEPGATGFLVGWCKPLLACCLLILGFVFILLLPMFLAGWLNTWLGGMGAVVVSLLLPVLLVVDLVLLVVALGALAWPLMPVTVAAECSDSFDAISRSYSYSFQRPVRFLLLTATALVLAGLPLGIVYALAENLTGWEPDVRQTVFVLAAALSLSMFWSLQTLVYLHLRAVVDGVEASVIAVGPPPQEAVKTSPEGKTAEAPAEVPAAGDSRPAGQRPSLRGTILLLGAAIGSWCLTFWLLGRASSGPTTWLGWGLGETFIPPAEGIYRVASMIAALWGVIWLALPLVVAVRRLRSGGAPPRAE